MHPVSAGKGLVMNLSIDEFVTAGTKPDSGVF